MRIGLYILLILTIFACQKEELVAVNNAPVAPSIPTEASGTSCVGISNADVYSTLKFKNTNTDGIKKYGCLLVNKLDKYPVFDGNESIRFEVRNCDCSWNATFNDCENDRSRHEIQEEDTPQFTNQVITYTTHVFIPFQNNFRPKGGNLMVLSQVNYMDQNNVFGALTYLVVEENNVLLIRTHKGFSWDWNQNYTITKNPFDKWYEIKYEVKVSSKDDGYIKVFVDNTLLFQENRPTIPTDKGTVGLKFGIYNSFKARATEPYGTQVVFMDAFAKTVK